MQFGYLDCKREGVVLDKIFADKATMACNVSFEKQKVCVCVSS